jgi:hypothetical protein
MMFSKYLILADPEALYEIVNDITVSPDGRVDYVTDGNTYNRTSKMYWMRRLDRGYCYLPYSFQDVSGESIIELPLTPGETLTILLLTPKDIPALLLKVQYPRNCTYEGRRDAQLLRVIMKRHIRMVEPKVPEHLLPYLERFLNSEETL